MEILNAILLFVVIVCAISVSLTKNLLSALIIFMTQSLVMCIIWILLESPDLAITEAAVGAGVTSLLLFAALYMLVEHIYLLTKKGESEA